MRICVSGANGFVGRDLCASLSADGHGVVRTVRDKSQGDIAVGHIGPDTDWRGALGGCDAVVHLAARVHVMHEKAADPLTEFWKINVGGTRSLAQQAAKEGVKRFIFLSTIKVLGEGQVTPYRADDPPAPVDAYAISKWEAEKLLADIAAETGMEVVILRPPLVYGQGVKGNFFSLMRAVDRGLPLPLGAIHNQRSLIYLGNLVDAIRVGLSHPAAAGKVFMVSDGEDVSTPELARRVAAALGRPALLLPVSVAWMRWAGRLLGRRAAVERLIGSLAVDIKYIQNDLGWSPPFSMQSGIAATAAWYRKMGAGL
ncbi:UDP-glucose 4-epimerase family protein [Sedimenticola hydrogenitrophicus]|uniref:UDP-glucose 4-epimerase family protein n=1 Tax=Sedimenticola hydrogenitrophicus TaxID=2967975 RepID=UPI0021A612AE|nr:SDR family oxidoreductase [Sedimenticola hydrogenitrophicus]